MRIASILISGAALWSSLAGCSNKPLQKQGPTGLGGISLDGGGNSGGGGGIGGSGGQNLPTDGGPLDATADLSSDSGPPLTGRRSYLVTSLLQRDGGIIGSAPTSHTFTLVVDADRHAAVAGGATGEGLTVGLEQTTSGALHAVGPLRFAISPNSCSGSSVSYADLTFSIDASDRLAGTGSGTITVAQGDTAQTVSTAMSLTGVADTQGPSLTIAGAGDPLVSFSVRASEPLPPGATATLRAEDGETIELSPSGITGSFVTSFQKPATTLRYGTRYQVVADGLTDFAGNSATGVANLIFVTRALPPLSALDGFESLTNTTFAGVSVLSSTDGPVIAGTKSLYIAPATTQPELSLRIPLAAGHTTLRFSYRIVKLSSGSYTYNVSWALGSERGTPAAPTFPADPTTTTDVMVGGKTWTLGPITTASFDLPAGTAGEVVLQRTLFSPNLCGFPPPPINGIIIDDLRTE